MISFRTKDDQIAAGLFILGLILLAASLIWMLIPVPSVAGIANGKGRSKIQIESDIKAQKQKNAALEAQIEPVLWVGMPEDVAPKALASITALAKARKIDVSFRPQKTVDIGGLTQIPFSVSVSGSFANAVQLLKDLQNPKHRLAVSLVQLTSADSASDSVTGTINVVAYLQIQQPPKQGTTSAKKS